MTKKKTFDAVEQQHQGAEVVRRETAGMTIEQEVEYWKRQTDQLREEVRAHPTKRKAS